jgi:hypothetical protein
MSVFTHDQLADAAGRETFFFQSFIHTSVPSIAIPIEPVRFF